MPAKSIPSIVLLVEDHPVIAMNTEILLMDLGVAEVRVAASVAAAMQLIESSAFDYAILDLKLGDTEDSLPIAELLTAKSVPIAFATGFGEGALLADAYPGIPVLKKPYGIEDLERLLSDG